MSTMREPDNLTALDARQPYRCPTCQRVLWTRADWPYCRTGHPHTEMRLIAVEGAPDTSPDIVT